MKNQVVLKKLKILLTISGICLALLVVRLVYLQLVKGESFLATVSRTTIRTTYIPAPRGEIKDRNGVILAHDLPRLNICAIGAEIKNIDQFVTVLSPLINYSEARTRRILERYKDNPYQKIVIKPKVETPVMMKVAEIQPDLPGLYFEVQPVREYPDGEIASHLLGYIGHISPEELKNLKDKNYYSGDYIGKDGIEKQYDQYLRGNNGQRDILVDAVGRMIGEVSERKPRAGNDIYLTIDANLQKDVYQILKWHVDSLSTVSREKLAAAAIVMDVRTGEILAMSSYPGFDPNSFAKGLSVQEYNDLIERKDYPMFARTISGEYVPASTFKIITTAAALQEGICTKHSPFNCPGYYKIGGQRFNCAVTSGHQKIDLVNSIAESCNVTFYILGNKMGIDRLLKYSKEFGLGRKTGIDLPGETAGLLPDSYWKLKTFGEPWYAGDTINTSIGQGFLNVTPIQMVQVTSAIANGGKIMKPYLLMKVENSQENNPTVLSVVNVEAQHLAVIRNGMISSVKKGTSKLLKSKMSAGGKTGTAESFASPENPHGRNHTWFTGFAPAENPEISVVVFFERSAGSGGSICAPIAGEILDSYHKHIYSKKHQAHKDANKEVNKEVNKDVNKDPSSSGNPVPIQ
jgi:penicillin-binding protein 2